MNYQTRIPGSLLPTTWMGRLIATIVAAALRVAGLFFVAFALVAAAVLALVVAVRIWWVVRKLRTQRDNEVIEGSYSIESEPTQRIPTYSTRGDSNPPDTK